MPTDVEGRECALITVEEIPISARHIDFAMGVADGGGWHDGGRVEITRDRR